jgi:hypothetical protein
MRRNSAHHRRVPGTLWVRPLGAGAKAVHGAADLSWEYNT